MTEPLLTSISFHRPNIVNPCGNVTELLICLPPEPSAVVSEPEPKSPAASAVLNHFVAVTATNPPELSKVVSSNIVIAINAFPVGGTIASDEDVV